MRALMASVELGVKRVGEIVDALRRRRRRGRACASSWTARGGSCASKLAENFAYGTHSFTDAIDGDGHGNGPFSCACRADARAASDGEDRFIFDATRDRRPGARARQFPDEPRRARHGARALLSRRRSRQVCNAGGPRRWTRCACAKARCCWPRFPAPLGMRGLTMMRVLGHAQRPRQRGRRQRAGGALRLCHLDHARQLPHASGELERFLLADGLGVGYGARPNADGIDAVYFVAQENYPVEFLELGYPGAAADLRHRRGQRRRRALSRRLRHRARIRDPRRGGDDGDPHRQREEPALGHRRRHVRRRRAARWSIRALTANASSRRCPTATCSSAATSCASRPAAAAAMAIRFDRPAETVLEDVLGGFVSREAAAQHLRRRDPRLRVDEVATQRCVRAARPATAPFPPQRVCRCPRLRPRSSVAVDIGGTFTDIALFDPSSGKVWRAKTPSVPSDPSEAFLTGVRLALAEQACRLPRSARVLHGTTVATNMILEGKGAPHRARDHPRLPPRARRSGGRIFRATPISTPG